MSNQCAAQQLVAVGILKRADTLLVAKRPQGKPYSGYWEFPGGKVEKNETSEVALYRELQEELNIRVTQAKLFLEHSHAYPDKTVLLHIWLVENYCGQVMALEHEALQWATLEEISHLKILEGSVPILEKIKKRLGLTY